MSSQISRYSLFCKNEKLTVSSYGYTPVPPTKCPRNESHEISNVSIVNTINFNNLTVSQTLSPNFNSTMLINNTFTIPVKQSPDEPNTFDTYYNILFDCEIFRIKISTNTKLFEGDLLNISMSPFNYIGESINIFNVGEYTCKYKSLTSVFPGMIARIENGTDVYQMGEIVKVEHTEEDYILVTFSNPAPITFPVTSITCVKIPLVSNYVVPKYSGEIGKEYKTSTFLCPKFAMKSKFISKDSQLCLNYKRNKVVNNDHNLIMSLEIAKY